MRAFRRSLLSFSIVLWASGALAGQAPTPRLYDVRTARGMTGAEPVGQTDVFVPDMNRIYVWFRQENVRIGQMISSRWYYDEPQPPDFITEASAVVESPSGWGQFNIEMPPGRPWPIGRYHVELQIDSKSAAVARFRVAASAPAGDAGGGRAPARGDEGRGAAPASSVYTHPRSGYQFAPPPGWSVSDDVPTAEVQLKSGAGDGLIEITSGPVSAKLEPVSYAAGWESVMVGPGRKLNSKRAGHPVNVDGEPAYEGTYEAQGVLIKVVFFGVPSRFFVVTGVFAESDFARGEPVFDKLIASFRARR